MNKAWLDIELLKIGEFTLLLGQLISFFVVIIFTIILSKLLQKGFKRLAISKGGVVAPTQLYVIGRFIHYLVLFIGLLVALTALGVKMTELAIIASALGIGIGLGLQGMVNNFVSGLVILLEKSLKVGDFIEVGTGIVGEVIEIHMRATLIRTNDNVDILIPNADLVSGMVTNWTLEENIRRFRIAVGVAYGSDKELVKKAILEAAANVKYTLNAPGREPTVWMTGFGDSSLDFMLGVWVEPEQVKRPTALVSDYLWAIDDAFRKYKIEIPFPQRDLHFRSSEAVLAVSKQQPD
ncbi:mechanosensitive ion channel family protein [Colwelliaceae bacterium 6471]